MQFRAPDPARGARLTPYRWRLDPPPKPVARDMSGLARGISQGIKSAITLHGQNQDRQDRRARQELEDKRLAARDARLAEQWEYKKQQLEREAGWKEQDRERSNTKWEYEVADRDRKRQERDLDRQLKINERFRNTAANIKDPGQWKNLVNRYTSMGFQLPPEYVDYHTGRAAVLAEMTNNIDDLKRRRLELQNKKLEAGLNSKSPGKANLSKDYRMRDDGSAERIPGSAADEKARDAQYEYKAAIDNVMSQGADISSMAKRIMDDDGLSSVTGWASMLPNRPGGAGVRIESDLLNLQSKMSFATLAAMLAASKTGGALGSVSERELEMLKNSIEGLNLGMDKDDFRDRLEGVVNHFNDVKNRLQRGYLERYGQSAPEATSLPPGVKVFRE